MSYEHRKVVHNFQDQFPSYLSRKFHSPLFLYSDHKRTAFATTENQKIHFNSEFIADPD